MRIAEYDKHQERERKSRSRQAVSPTASFRSEVVFITVVFAVFLSVNFATSSRLPPVYIDEVSYSDPAVNLYLGNGFTSTAWPAQTKDEFWAGHGPLYSALLYLWMRPFGFSPVAVRSLNYVLIVISMFMLWLGVVRLKLISSHRHRIALLTLLLLSYGLAFNYRTGRLDCVAIMLFTASALVYSIQSSWIRYLLLSCIGILLPMAGLQMVAFATIFCVLLLIYLGKPFLRESGSLAIGTVVGATLLYTLYSLHGVMHGFHERITRFSIIGKGLTGFFVSHSLSKDISVGFPFILAKDISFPFLLAAALAVTAYQIRKAPFKLRSPLSFGLTVGFCVPLGVFMLGHYPAYYSWMAFIPLAVCTFSVLSELYQDNRGHLMIKMATGFLFVAGLVGLPLHLALAAYDWGDRDYAPVEALSGRNVTKTDWVFCDFGAYYAVKKRAAVVILPPYLNVIPSYEKERISVLIINPGALETVRRKLGGEWYDTGDGISPEVEGLFGFPIQVGLLTLPKYKLRVFRRVRTSKQPYLLPQGPMTPLG